MDSEREFGTFGTFQDLNRDGRVDKWHFSVGPVDARTDVGFEIVDGVVRRDFVTTMKNGNKSAHTDFNFDGKFDLITQYSHAEKSVKRYVIDDGDRCEVLETVDLESRKYVVRCPSSAEAEVLWQGEGWVWQ